jgi:N-formylglutamate amidohydrolase
MTAKKKKEKKKQQNQGQTNIIGKSFRNGFITQKYGQ